MINDPLLPSTRSKSREDSSWAPPVREDLRVETSSTSGRTSHATPASRSRRRHPAISSRILAVGVSTSAMFALTAGYAAAERKSAPTPIDGVTPTQDGVAQQSAQDPMAQQNATAQQLAPGQVDPRQQATPQQAAPRVVQVPVEPAAPATPAPSGSGGGNTQQSSGSN